MTEMDGLFWTDEQWESWEETVIVVDAVLLERLSTGAELLTKGARLNQDQRTAWTAPLKLCQEILDRERAAITSPENATATDQDRKMISHLQSKGYAILTPEQLEGTRCPWCGAGDES